MNFRNSLRIIHVLCAAGCFMPRAVLAVPVGDSAADLLLSARRSYEAGAYSETASVLDRLSRATNSLSLAALLSAQELRAELYFESGKLTESQQITTELLRRLQAERDVNADEAIQAAHVRLSAIASARGGRTLAVAELQHSLAIPAGLRRKNPLWEPRLYVQLAELTRDNESRAHLRTAHAMVEAILDDKAFPGSRAKAGLLLAAIQTKQGNLPAAELTLQRQLALAKRPNDDERYELSLRLAECQRGLKKFAEAVTNLDVASALAGTQADPARQAEILGERAALLAVQLEREKAESCWRSEAATINRLLSTKPGMKAAFDDLTPGQRIEKLRRLLVIQRNLAQWTEGIAVAEDLLRERRQTLLVGDVNIERSEAVLAGFCALAALDTRPTLPETETPSRRSRHELVEFATSLLESRRKAWSSDPRGLELELFRVLSNLVELRRFAGDFPAAYQGVLEAQALIEPLYADGRLSELERAAFRVNAGSVYAGMAKYGQALQLYQLAALEFDNPIPWKAIEVRSVANLNAAILYRSQGQLEVAESFGREASRLRDLLGNDHGEQRIPFALVLGSIELAKLDRRAAAFRMAGKTLDVHSDARESNAADSNEPQPPPKTLLNEATRHAQDASHWLVEYGLQDAPIAVQVNHLQAQTLLQSYLWNDAADPQQVLGQAQTLWKTVQQHAKRFRFRAEQARSLSSQLEVAFCQARLAKRRSAVLPSEADVLSREAVELVEQLHAYPNLQCQVLLQRAQILLKRSDPRVTFEEEQQSVDPRPLRQEAVTRLEQALALIEMPRASTTGASEERADFYAYFSPVFDLLVDTYVAEGQFEMAMHVSEWRRNRTLLDQLRAARNGQAAPLERENPELQDLRSRERAAVEQLKEAYASARALTGAVDESSLLPSTPDESNMDVRKRADRLEQLNRKVEDVARLVVDLRRKIHELEPYYRNVLAEGVGSDLHNTTAAAFRGLFDPALGGDPKQVVLMYHIGQWRSHLFILSSTGSPQHFSLSITDPRISQIDTTLERGALTSHKARLIVSWFLAIAGNSGKRAPGEPESSPMQKFDPWADDQWSIASRTLFPQAAVEGLRRLKPARISVAPDGPLHQLPLEMVGIDSKQYVIDVLPPISYLPSILIAQALAKRPHGVTGRSLLLTVAPDYRTHTHVDANAPSSSRERAKLIFANPTDIPAAGEESQRVSELFAGLAHGSATAPIICLGRHGKPATKLEVIRAIEGAKFVHFAAHGMVVEDFRNLFGGLLLTPGIYPEEHDAGVLSLYDIERLRLAGCELVMLSACDTNRGADLPLEAGSTLARAFLASGVERVVCSQWKVDDNSTKELIVDFTVGVTKQLATGGTVDYALALHKARQNVRSNSRWQDPHHWASFILIGPALEALQ